MEVLILLGSKSDLSIGQEAKKVLDQFGISNRIAIASAHRSPERVREMVRGSEARVFIGIAGMSAALPGVIASMTVRPVIGVPANAKLGLDSVLSVTQMPPGVPVAAVGLDRGENAGLLAAQILAVGNPELTQRLLRHKQEMEAKVAQDSEAIGS